LAALSASNGPSPDPVIDELLGTLVGRLGVETAALALVEGDQLRFAERRGLALQGAPRDATPCGQVVSCGELLVLRDASADERFREQPLVAGEPHLRFFAGAPLFDAEGQVFGALWIADPSPRDLEDADRELLASFARFAARSCEQTARARA